MRECRLPTKYHQNPEYYVTLERIFGVQISEFEINICTCKLTSSESLPSFKPYVSEGGEAEAGTGANFYTKETEHHIKGDSSKPIEVRCDFFLYSL